MSPSVAPGWPVVPPFVVSWTDAGRAVRAALKVPSLPTPCEVIHINADLPHGVFPNLKAKRVLGWQPHDRLEQLLTEAATNRE